MKSNEVMQEEKKFLMQTYKRSKVVLERGKGIWVWDKNGKKYLDFIAGIATCSVGHNNSAVIKVMVQQAKKIINATNLFYTEPQVALAKELSRLSGLQRCFFSNSGSESVETSLKLARKYTGKKKIISTRYAFHGRTFGALTATWNKKYREYCKPLVPGFKKIDYNDTQALEKAIDRETAAFIVEPIQGETGIIVPGKDYLKEAREICDKHDVLLILDEIQTGTGRTGKFFAYQHENIKPDIVTLAKGIGNGFPIGITLARDGIDFEFGQQGTTFGGNSLACSVALSVINFIEKNGLMENAKIQGNYFIRRLNELKNRFSSIKEVRGKGLMVGLEFKRNSKDEFNKCLDNGLLLNCISKKIFRFLPPLIVKRKDIDLAIKILEEVLEK